jgi:hypothetical protein
LVQWATKVCISLNWLLLLSMNICLQTKFTNDVNQLRVYDFCIQHNLDQIVRKPNEGVIFNLQLCIYSVASFFKEHVYIPTLQFNSA